MIRTKTKLKNKAKTIEGLYSDAVEVIYSEELSRIIEQGEKEYIEGKMLDGREVFRRLHEKYGIW